MKVMGDLWMLKFVSCHFHTSHSTFLIFFFPQPSKNVKLSLNSQATHTQVAGQIWRPLP